ncbi:MAG: hypothetical protein V1798_02225 [Pseudomonadota bacterium]
MRLFLAWDWSRHPTLVQIAAWPPLYFVVYGLPLRWLGADPLILGHGVTCLFHGAFIYFSGRLLVALDPDRHRLPWGALLVAVSPLPALLSISLLSETMFCALLTGFLLAMVRWSEERVGKYLLMATLSCILMTMIRFEGWALAVGFAAFLLSPWGARRKWWLVAAVAVFPIAWLVQVHNDLGGGPFEVFRAHSEEILSFFADKPGWRWIPWRSMAAFFPIPCLVAVLYPLVWHKMSKASRMFFFFGMATAAFYLTLNTMSLMSVLPERSVLVPGILLLLLFLLWLPRVLKGRVMRLAAVGVLLVSDAIGFTKLHFAHDREAAQTASCFASEQVWKLEALKNGIATDADNLHLAMLSLVSKHPTKFRRIRFEDGMPLLPGPDVPRVFLLYDDRLVRFYKGRLKRLRSERLGATALLAENPALRNILASGAGCWP